MNETFNISKDHMVDIETRNGEVWLGIYSGKIYACVALSPDGAKAIGETLMAAAPEASEQPIIIYK